MALASGAARICLSACRRAPRLRPLYGAQPSLGPRSVATRPLSTSLARWAETDEPKQGGEAAGEFEDALQLNMMNKSFAESVSVEGLQQLDELAKDNGHTSIDEFLVSYFRDNFKLASEDRMLAEELKKIETGEKPNVKSFWYDEDDPETNTEEHDVFDEDDITSMAHGKLDEVREMRQYARQVVWEMPLLSKLAKPFEPPTESQVLRWRYTTYMGESHPAEKKVVVQFAPDDLKLTPVQTLKLKKLAGPRYNPETEFIKMSCESFEHQAQNKRYLSQLVDDLIAAAKDPTDTFEDVPLDLRHHPIKAKPKFPKAWRLTEKRQRHLTAYREKVALAEKKRMEEGRLIDGQQIVDNFLIQKAVKEQEEQAKLQAAELAPALRSSRSAGAPSRARAETRRNR